ncbi:MAG TPA: hypothetical protein VF708_00240 [Pyrinomonadaceae bacterium]
MPVQNLLPGHVLGVPAGMIGGEVVIYRMAGNAGVGTVGWQPANSPVQMRNLDVAGQHAFFQVNGAAGMIANGCPATVQVMWTNPVASNVLEVIPNKARQVLYGRSFARAATDPGQEAMEKLTAQWYNAVVNGCGLDPNTFQLFQGNQPIYSTSEQLWNIFDAVPPPTINNYFNPGQFNVFSSDYGAVINNLKPQNAGRFQTDMGDYYALWIAYLRTGPAMPRGGIQELFSKWAYMNMPPDQAQQVITDWAEVSQGVVPVAVQMWLNAGGSTGGVKAYNNTIATLKNAIASTPGKSFQMDSSTESADVSHTWAEGEVGGFFEDFWGGASASYSQMTQMLATAGIQIKVTFQHLLTFATGPLAKVSTDPILSQYQPWYFPPALNLAFQNNNNVVWNNTPPTWANTFGPNGNMLRVCSAVVVVDGIDIEMESEVGFSTSQQTQFEAAASGGFFPFFEAEASGGWTHNSEFDSNGNVTVTSSSPTGNPNILGVIVTPINHAIASHLQLMQEEEAVAEQPNTGRGRGKGKS